MAGIFTAVNTISAIFNAAMDTKGKDIKEFPKEMFKNMTNPPIISTDGSITKFLSSFIVEPVVILTKDVKKTEIADKLVILNTDIFSSFYMQAFYVLTNMYRLDATMAVKVLGTDNSGVFSKSTAIGALKAANALNKSGFLKISTSERDYLGELASESNRYLSFSCEGDDDKNKDPVKYRNNKVGELESENLYYIHHRDIKLTISTKDQHGNTKDIIIPITIKTHIIATTIDQILNMLKPNDRTKSFSYRLDEWRAGAISLKELIFCGDLIKSYKQNKLKDKDGLLNIIKQREESANAKALDTRMVGFEKYYNMLLVTADEKVLLNKHIGGDILNERYKQDLMNQAHALTLSVVDEDYERVYILTKDIRGRSDVTFKSIAKKSNKESESAEIVKALMSNKPPVF